MSALSDAVRHLTHEEWFAEGRRRFGPRIENWRWECPVCKHVASGQDWKDAGAPEGAIAFSCVGRWLPGSRDALAGEGPGPCNYIGGGLFALNPVVIDDGRVAVFEWAPARPEVTRPPLDEPALDDELVASASTFATLFRLVADLVQQDCGGPVPPQGWERDVPPFRMRIGGKDSGDLRFMLEVSFEGMPVFMLDYASGQCLSLGSKPVEECLEEELLPALRAALAPAAEASAEESSP